MTRLHESAIEACRQYEAAAFEINGLTKAIGDALMECPTLDPAPGLPETPGGIPGNWTHLRFLYKAIVSDSVLVGPEMATAVLCGDVTFDEGEWEVPGFHGQWPESMACEHCLRAHELIQRRKEARQRFGAAKRYVRMVGKRSAQA